MRRRRTTPDEVYTSEDSVGEWQNREMGHTPAHLGHLLRFLLGHWTSRYPSRRGNAVENRLIRVYFLPALPFANRVLKGAFGSRLPSDRKGRDGASPPSTQRRVDVA